MKKVSIIILVAIFILCFTITGCGNKNNVKKINAESFIISYGKSIYKVKDKVEQETVDSLVKNYNNIKLDGTTNRKINYDKAITIIFINDNQISRQITVDDKGICHIDGKLYNYIISEESNIYLNALKVYHDLKRKYES